MVVIVTPGKAASHCRCFQVAELSFIRDFTECTVSLIVQKLLTLRVRDTRFAVAFVGLDVSIVGNQVVPTVGVIIEEFATEREKLDQSATLAPVEKRP